MTNVISGWTIPLNPEPREKQSTEQPNMSKTNKTRVTVRQITLAQLNLFDKAHLSGLISNDGEIFLAWHKEKQMSWK